MVIHSLPFCLFVQPTVTHGWILYYKVTKWIYYSFYYPFLFLFAFSLNALPEIGHLSILIDEPYYYLGCLCLIEVRKTIKIAGGFISRYYAINPNLALSLSSADVDLLVTLQSLCSVFYTSPRTTLRGTRTGSPTPGRPGST